MSNKRSSSSDRGASKPPNRLRPLTRNQLARLKPIKAKQLPPPRSILSGLQTIFVSQTKGKRLRPAVKANRVTTSRGQDIWRVEVDVGDASANPRFPLKMDRVARNAIRKGVHRKAVLDGFCPPWAEVTFLPRRLPRAAIPELQVRGRRVNPLYIFNDRRKPVVNPNFPWWCVGLVKNSRGQTGSGALIGRNIVLTAGHVVPWGDNNGWLTFSPAFNIPTVNFGEWPVTWAHGYVVANPPQDFESVAYDYALLQLDTPLGDTLGFFGAVGYSDDWDGTGYWTSLGYPDDFGGNPAFEDADTVEDADSEDNGLYLETEASLTHGNSGGPFMAWFQFSNGLGPGIIGVVSAEGTEAFPQDSDNFLGSGNAMLDLISWGRANMGP